MADKNLHKDHRKRLRKRYAEEGIDFFEDHNVLELLLFYALPRVDTNPIAHRLISRFGSLSGVFSASEDELCEVEGMGKASARFIKLVADSARQCELRELSQLRMDRPERPGAYFVKWFSTAPWESSCMMSLDPSMKFISCDILNWGDEDRPVSICDTALSLARERKASKVILAHSHGDGKMRPSPDDINLTREISREMEKHSVQVVSHYIVSGYDYIDIIDRCIPKEN